jgi:DNA primase
MNVKIEQIQQFMKVKLYGINYMGLCPYHNERTPSFVLSIEKQIFICFGCNKSGTLNELLNYLENGREKG